MTGLLGIRFDQEYNPKNNPAYLYFRQSTIIDINEINKYSNFVSEVGPNRPIIIMEYDEKISKIFLNSNKYTIEPVHLQNLFNFKKITVDYEGTKLLVYVFDHQKYDQFNVILFEGK